MRRLLALAAALAAAAAGPSACGGRAPAGGAASPAGRAGDAAEVLGRFCRALEAGRFDEAHALLSSRWRSVYTPGRLALDRSGAGPAAAENVRRVLAILADRSAVVVDGERALLALGPDRAAVLVREPGGWRVDALE